MDNILIGPKFNNFIILLYFNTNYIISDVLQQGASQFEQHATKLKRKMWWKNLKVYYFI